MQKLCFESETFEFNVSSYSTDALTQAERIEELERDGKTHVRMDYKVSGIGSNSCGPELEKTFRLDEKKIRFDFSVKPVTKNSMTNMIHKEGDISYESLWN